MAVAKLVYFDIRGRGEAVRLAVAAAGKKLDDVRISSDKWPAEKPNTPYGQLPYVEYKGKKYGQSNALAAFFAREFGLYGKTNLETLRIEEAIGLVEDLRSSMIKANFEPDEKRKAELAKKLTDEAMPTIFGHLERLLKDNGGKGFFVGSAITLADLMVYDILDTVLKNHPDVLTKLPELKKMRVKVSENPNVKSYLASRKETDF